MKKNIILLLSVLLSITSFNSQDSETKARDILSKISEETKSYSNMSFNFNLAIKSQDINETQIGSAILSGEKFYYSTEDRQVNSDGKSVWTYMKDDNECYIDDINDLSEGLNPSEIMTIWEDNFKVNFIDESIIGGEKIQKIKLYPIDVKNSKYHTVILKVNEEIKQIKSATIKTKDGVTLIFSISEMEANKKIKEGQFSWNSTNYPGVDEIDNR
ncbi:MAG: outer membrane lipoprotein carrier protein LolA [Bacteroidota bacterium]|nr:outer membrane lipoprotein carrier protein LolA [Bacteroidota bacterium]